MKNLRLSELKTEDRVNQLLEEIRIVIPGTQVIFGFQLIVVFQELFQKLPEHLKDIHLLSLFLVALSILFLLAPSSFDRILEQQETVDHFRFFSKTMIMIALFLIALGTSLDIFVVLQQGGLAEEKALYLSLGFFIFSVMLWFLLPIIRRYRK